MFLSNERDVCSKMKKNIQSCLNEFNTKPTSNTARLQKCDAGSFWLESLSDTHGYHNYRRGLGGLGGGRKIQSNLVFLKSSCIFDLVSFWLKQSGFGEAHKEGEWRAGRGGWRQEV